MRRRLRSVFSTYLPWVVEEVTVPLLPLLFLVVVRLLKTRLMVGSWDLCFGGDAIFWSSEVPFFSLILSATTFIRAHDLYMGVRRANETKRRRKNPSDAEKEALSESEGLQASLYFARVLLVGPGALALLLLALYYYFDGRGEPTRPDWAGVWMGGQLGFAALIFVVAVNVKRLEGKSKQQIDRSKSKRVAA